MAEAGEAQLKVAMIHYQQMEKANRDATHARRADDEFKQLLLQFPNSPFVEEAKQRLREVQEVLAQHEFDVGQQYFIKGNPRAAILRLKDLTEQYPNFSQSDDALWMMGQSFEKGGKDFRPKAAEAYAKIVSDYPLSDRVEPAKEKLTEWNLPVPQPKPEMYERQKYDLEHIERRGFFGRALSVFSKRPDVSTASKAGEPVLLPGGRPGDAGMTDIRATPADAAGGTGIRLEAVPLSTETPAQPGQPPAAPPAAQPPATPPPAQPQKPDSGGAPAEQAALTPPANVPDPAAAAAPSSDKPTEQPQPNAKNTKKKKEKKKKAR
jgi:outer membrane protein assembly factor BamD